MALTVITPTVYQTRMGKILLAGTSRTMTNTYPTTGSVIFPFGLDCIFEIGSNWIPEELPLKFLIISSSVNRLGGCELELTGKGYNVAQELLIQKSFKYPIGGMYGATILGDTQAEGCVHMGPVGRDYYVGLEIAFRSFGTFIEDTIEIAAGYQTNFYV